MRAIYAVPGNKIECFSLAAGEKNWNAHTLIGIYSLTLSKQKKLGKQTERLYK